MSVFSCLNRRVGDEALLRREVAALERERNDAGAVIDWRFSTQDARSKLQHIYPSGSVLVALAVLVALVATVGLVWFGWWDIARNRRIMDSLPLPPGAERTYTGSDPYPKDNSFVTPPERWGTLARFEAPGRTSEYLVDFYVSRMSSKWDYCIRRSVPGARFIARGFVVSLDASNAVEPPPNGGSFELYVEYHVDRNPCEHELK